MSDTKTILAAVGVAVASGLVLVMVGYRDHIVREPARARTRETEERRLTEEEEDPTPSLTYANANNVDLPNADISYNFKSYPILANTMTTENVPATNLKATPVNGGKRRKRESKRRKTNKKRKTAKRRQKNIELL